MSGSRERGGRFVVPRVAVVLGIVSLLNDVASEMVYPLLPTLLASLGAGAASLGLVEGVGDATASVLKLFAGKLSDRVRRRKPLAVLGYGLSALVKPFFAFAVAPWQVVGVRFLDRVGKGIRTSPRDALLAASVSRGRAGAVFGFHRAMDNIGATLGPLSVVFLLAAVHDVKKTVAWSAIPGLLSILFLVFGVDDAPAKESPALTESPSHDRAPAALRAYLVILGAFAIVNTSDLFLLRRLGELGASPSLTAIAWSLLNGVRALAGYPGGVFADKLGRSRSMILGWLVYAGSYTGMAFAPTTASFIGAMGAYGLFYGFTEGAERALVASLVSRSVIGSAFGKFHLVVGLASLPSNVLFGWAWDRFGGTRCLLASAAGAVLALLALTLWTRTYAPRASS